MCGIIGGSGNKFQLEIKKNFHLLNRRGPDNQKLLTLENGLILGATRLSMTDPLPRSNQPMENYLTGDMIVFNGEIYNYKRIRNRLCSLGIRFDTDSDTEVLLKSLSFYGMDFIDELEGMFSFVFYDKKNNIIVLARDFLGKKPLYFHTQNESIIFSSQIEIIKKSLGVVEIDETSLTNYLILGYVVDPLTIYRDICAVNPGELIVFDLNAKKITQRKNFFPKALKNISEYNLRQSISKSILVRTEGHDSFALSLSGGLDSSIIALTTKQLKLNATAFSMRWPEADKNRYNFDFDNALLFANKLKMPFCAVDMPNVRSIPDLLTEFTKAMEEPNSNPTGLSMMVFYSKIAESGHRLVLTGDGADEIFGGYERYSIANKLRYLPQFNDNILSSLRTKLNWESNVIEKLFTAISSSNESFWLYWQKIADIKSINSIYNSNNGSMKIDFPKSSLDLINRSKNRVANLLVRDLKTWLVMESNRKLDRVSMWNSIEARSPFLDENVIGQGFNEMAINRYRKLSKQILIQLYPELAQFNKKYEKFGFVSPLGFWLRENPDLIYDSIKYLNSNFNFDKNRLIMLADAPNNGNFNDFRFLWSLIVLANWHSNHFL